MFTYLLVYKRVLLLYCSLLPSRIKKMKLWFLTWLQIMLLSKVEYNHMFPGFEIKVETNIFQTNWVVSNFTTYSMSRYTLETIKLWNYFISLFKDPSLKLMQLFLAVWIYVRILQNLKKMFSYTLPLVHFLGIGERLNIKGMLEIVSVL